jgi:P27 family predicted phage terminase small subunit
MKTRGPAPKPTQIKVLQGTYRPDRAPAGEVFPEPPDDLSPPDWLSQPARDKWSELAPTLVGQGLLTVCDLDTLALYCGTFARWREAEETLEREGSTTTAQSGYKQISPHYTIARNSLAELRALGDRLGLNASARSRISTRPETKKEDELLA